MSDWNTQVIAEFRANGGKVAQFGDAPLVILNTIGAKSGKLREIPLVALVEEDAFVVFASKAGATSDPDWAYNLRSNPEIDVEHGAEKFAASVVELPETEGQERLAAQAALAPQFAEYIESAKPRVIPAFRITRR
ncbi:MAG: nitroreductase/quinone reductase family protein [Actinomycetota bacterium]